VREGSPGILLAGTEFEYRRSQRVMTFNAQFQSKLLSARSAEGDNPA